jgi:deazaflavin-dependent oxidoreductase (nitroreductase family)
MDTDIRDALQRGGIVDITTTGRSSGRPRRIEIYFHAFDGAYYITGRPGFKRDWLANITANPSFTLHLKDGPVADVAATGTPIGDPARRARVLYRILTESWGTSAEKAAAQLDTWVGQAPLIEFTVD